MYLNNLFKKLSNNYENNLIKGHYRKEEKLKEQLSDSTWILSSSTQIGKHARSGA